MKNDVGQKHEWKFDDWKGERKEERKEGEERKGIGTDVSPEIWRNPRVDAAVAHRALQ